MHTLLTVSAVVAAVAAAARSTWSPCGVSMLATVTPLAGAYSPFTLTFSRHDGEQDLSGIAVQTPAGLLGKIAGVPECGEVQANAPKQDFSQASCPSFRPKFGHASVWSFKSECGVNWSGRDAA